MSQTLELFVHKKVLLFVVSEEKYIHKTDFWRFIAAAISSLAPAKRQVVLFVYGPLYRKGCFMMFRRRAVEDDLGLFEQADSIKDLQEMILTTKKTDLSKKVIQLLGWVPRHHNTKAWRRAKIWGVHIDSTKCRMGKRGSNSLWSAILHEFHHASYYIKESLDKDPTHKLKKNGYNFAIKNLIEKIQERVFKDRVRGTKYLRKIKKIKDFYD